MLRGGISASSGCAEKLGVRAPGLSYWLLRVFYIPVRLIRSRRRLILGAGGFLGRDRLLARALGNARQLWAGAVKLPDDPRRNCRRAARVQPASEVGVGKGYRLSLPANQGLAPSRARRELYTDAIR
jgi:hypothetical protein